MSEPIPPTSPQFGAGNGADPAGAQPPLPQHGMQGSAPQPFPTTSENGQPTFGYAQPPAGYTDSQAVQPTAGYAYQQPGQPQPNFAQPQVGGKNFASDLKTAYWLTVLFGALAALIFFLIDKDKGNPRARQLLADNLNFSILRILATFVLFVPFLGILVSIALFVIQIIAAVKVESSYNTGDPQSPFLFNLPMVK